MNDGLTIHVPMTFQRRGGRKLIVLPHRATLAIAKSGYNVDSVLVKALARAFRWQGLLDKGTYSTIKEIAAKEKVDKSYVGDVLRLNLLAPDLIEMILDGKQPSTLQFTTLRRPFVLEWRAQADAIANEWAG